MTTTEPTLAHVFTRRAEQWADARPVASAFTEVVAANLRDGDALLGAPLSDASNAIWGRADLFIGAVTETLRTKASGHELAEYWPTLGGRRPLDQRFGDAVADLIGRYAEPLRAACTGRTSRQNDPNGIAGMWPAIVRAVGQRPVGLVELGGTAGFGLLPDRYGYRYGDVHVPGDGLELSMDVRGATPSHLDSNPTVRHRTGIELDPVRHDDSAAIAWLRDCVCPDQPDKLARIDAAVAQPELSEVDWRAGDYFVELPDVLAGLPDDVLPVVYGAHTLCCAEGRERLPRILADAGRELVWISQEHPGNALGLVSDAADEYGEDAKSRILITSVHYVSGRIDEICVAAEVDGYGTWIDWAPRLVAIR